MLSSSSNAECLSSSHAECPSSVLPLSNASDREDDTDSLPEKTNYCIIAEQSTWQQLASASFLYMCVFYGIHSASSQWNLVTQRDFLAHLGDNADGNRYLTIFTLLMPLSVVAMPWVISLYSVGGMWSPFMRPMVWPWATASSSCSAPVSRGRWPVMSCLPSFRAFCMAYPSAFSPPFWLITWPDKQSFSWAYLVWWASPWPTRPSNGSTETFSSPTVYARP